MKHCIASGNIHRHWCRDLRQVCRQWQRHDRACQTRHDDLCQMGRGFYRGGRVWWPHRPARLGTDGPLPCAQHSNCQCFESSRILQQPHFLQWTAHSFAISCSSARAGPVQMEYRDAINATGSAHSLGTLLLFAVSSFEKYDSSGPTAFDRLPACECSMIPPSSPRYACHGREQGRWCTRSARRATTTSGRGACKPATCGECVPRRHQGGCVVGSGDAGSAARHAFDVAAGRR